MAELIPLLQALMVTDNAVRRAAEESFHSGLAANPLVVVNSLLTICVQPDIDPILRSMSAVLLRGIFEARLETFAEADTHRIREQVYICWNQESVPHVRRKFAHLLAQIASQTSWADLVPGILTSSSSPESVLHLLEILSEYIPDEVAESAASYWPYLSNALSSSNPAVKLAGAKATAACVVTIHDEGALKVPVIDPGCETGPQYELHVARSLCIEHLRRVPQRPGCISVVSVVLTGLKVIHRFTTRRVLAFVSHLLAQTSVIIIVHDLSDLT